MCRKRSFSFIYFHCLFFYLWLINSKLTEEEAFAAEASLINAFNYVSDERLTNIVAGHHSAEALSVDEYERINGAVELKEKDIRHKILVMFKYSVFSSFPNIEDSLTARIYESIHIITSK